MKHLRVLFTLALGLALMLGLLLVLRGASGTVRAESALDTVPPTLTRAHDPVVIPGASLAGLAGTPLDQIFVYAYAGDTPQQIPFQIDERDTKGMYVALEDGQLDANDELVFMAIDGGGRVDFPFVGAGGTFISPNYVVTITDPISDTYAWAYVYHSDALAPTFTADYVSYQVGDDRITSPGRYSLAYSTTHEFWNYMTLGDGATNLLDRSKLWITATLPGIPVSYTFTVDEGDVTKDGVHAIDGPIRVTRVSTSNLLGLYNPIAGTLTQFAYRSLLVQPVVIAVPDAPVIINSVRTSVDWNERGIGSTYYDANNPDGVTVDGVPDTITDTPPTKWTQVTNITGTFVNVSKVPVGLGGTQSTYYEDDNRIHFRDTGDQRRYGDAGFKIDGPNPGTYTGVAHSYFLTGTSANVGGTYLDYYDNPLQVSVAVFNLAPMTFTLSASPDARIALPNEVVSYTMTISYVSGYRQPVVLSVEGVPSGVSADWSANPVAPDGVSILTLVVPSSPTFGTYTLPVVGVAGETQVTQNVRFIIAYVRLFLPIFFR